MGETFVCDNCDERISTGYTVCYARKLTDSPAGVHYSTRNRTYNLCPECFPSEVKLQPEGIIDMLRTLFSCDDTEGSDAGE